MYNKLICILLLIIIISSGLLLIRINNVPVYDKEVYNQIYQEYEEIKSSTNNSTVNSDVSLSTFNSKNKPIRTFKNATGNTYRTIGVIDIPKINLSYPVINDYSETNLNIAPTKFVGPEINEVGNFVIVGHNNWNREFFSNLNKLEKDDIVNLTDHNKVTQSYKVYDIYEVKQDDFSSLNQNTNGKIELTLITCIKYQKNKRLVVKCVAI